MYGGTSAPGNRLPAHNPIVTAGLIWHPEIDPIVNAIVNRVRPKASATPRNPIPVFGKPAASTALPHPPKTSQKVPINSAVKRRDILMAASSKKSKINQPYRGAQLNANQTNV